MALDRVWKLYREGLTDRAPVDVWLSPVDGSPIIASIDADRGTPIETAVLRMRYRDDATLGSVFVSPDGDIWIPSEFRRVGRRALLEVAVTHYEDAALEITPTPPVTPLYTPQAGYTLQKDGAAVQSLTVASIALLLPDVVNFKLTNPDAAGSLPEVHVRIGAAGPTGLMQYGSGGGFFALQTGALDIQVGDALIPPARLRARDGQPFTTLCRVAAAGAGAALNVGGYVRILSQEEVPND